MASTWWTPARTSGGWLLRLFCRDHLLFGKDLKVYGPQQIPSCSVRARAKAVVASLGFELCPYWEHPSLEETPERHE